MEDQGGAYFEEDLKGQDQKQYKSGKMCGKCGHLGLEASRRRSGEQFDVMLCGRSRNRSGVHAGGSACVVKASGTRWRSTSVSSFLSEGACWLPHPHAS